MFMGSTTEYVQIKPLEYSTEPALALHFDISVLKNGPKFRTRRLKQTYAVSSRLCGRKVLSIQLASSIDFESDSDLIVMRFQVRELCLEEDMNDAILDRYEFVSAISFVWCVTLWNYGGRECDIDTLATEL
ncbi:uncharacterized protein N7529_003461 [Penicillium soppii]|uniref:uncharacterized protein n=1 Tax=Penicillium soppii TaxID=69789 RepID=UPI002548789D|nr:uncharacterized protein N7529_003461 [Penicillium soppii]KAJ5871108.1 hypothetical protein N7529_003461 [Penicillium soppii]